VLESDFNTIVEDDSTYHFACMLLGMYKEILEYGANSPILAHFAANPVEPLSGCIHDEATEAAVNEEFERCACGAEHCEGHHEHEHEHEVHAAAPARERSPSPQPDEDGFIEVKGGRRGRKY
jgi:hypothetical protein